MAESPRRMSKLIWSIRTYLSLIRIGFLKSQIYSLAVALNHISSLALITLQYYLWKSLYNHNDLGHYKFEALFSYLVLGQVLHSLYPSTVSTALTSEVRSGDISHSLLKPIGLIRILLGESLGETIFKVLNTSLPVFLFSYLIFRLNLDIGLLHILKFLPIIFLSCLFVFIFEFLMGLLSFRTISSWGVNSLKYALVTLLSGRFLPLSLYPSYMRRVLKISPFKIMYDSPINFLLEGLGDRKGSEDFNEWIVLLSYQILWILGLALLAAFLYKKMLNKLMIQGG